MTPLASHRERFNPLEYLASREFTVSRGDVNEMRRLRPEELAHIRFDPEIVPEYRIIRGTRHDGTMLFTEELIGNALMPLVNRESYYRRTKPADWSTVRDIRYVVGLARLATAYGTVDLPVGRYPGQRERITIPVRCEYVWRE